MAKSWNNPENAPKSHGRMPKNPQNVKRVKPRVVKATAKPRGGKSMLAPDSSGCAVTAVALAGGVVATIGAVGYGVSEAIKVVF